MKRAGDPPYGSGESAVFRTRRQSARRTAPEGAHWHVLSLGARTAKPPPAATARKPSKRRAPAEILEGLRDAEVFVLIEPDTEPPLARVVTIDAAGYVLVFETEAMLEALAGEEAERLPVPMQGFLDYLRGRNVGLALNVGDRDRSVIVPADDLTSLLEPAKTAVSARDPEPEPVLEPVPEEEITHLPAEAPEPAPQARHTVQFSALLAPREFPDTLLNALSDTVGRMSSMCDRALLFRAHYDDGQVGFLVGLSGVGPKDRGAFEMAVNDLLARSRREDLKLDIAFLDRDDPVLDRVSRVGVSLKPDAARR